jgi:hypothetical protein
MVNSRFENCIQMWNFESWTRALCHICPQNSLCWSDQHAMSLSLASDSFHIL